MALSDEEIRQKLTEFAAAWGGYQGTEKAEAQTFLNELLGCYGTDRKAVATFEERTEAGGFMDLIWPEVCLIEMKRPTEAEKLQTHCFQALRYWQDVSRKASESGKKAPEWIVVCAFERFLVLDPDAGWDKPVDDIPLAELPERSAALAFLAGNEPHFRVSQADLSREAVASLTDLYQGLRERGAADIDELRPFILQIVWCLFAEDLGILPEDGLRRVLESLIKDSKRSSADDLHQLFQYLAVEEPRPPEGSLFAKTPYANGGLFEHPARVHLTVEELTTLREACDLDWRQVEPAIFGSILQGALGKEKQWALGAHYTTEADIMKAVGPTIVDPWNERISNCSNAAEAEAAWRDLMDFVVLDPACGSGNFLYVAYRELREIEAGLRKRLAELRAAEGIAAQEVMEFFPISNMKGIEIETFAVELAHVVLWIAHKLAADEMSELGVSEPTLPLADLSGLKRADALRVAWPEADAIVSNPPYHGSQRIRGELGDSYVDFLKDEFKIGVKDYAVYWIRKAQDLLRVGGRAGIVATNSITQNRNRKASLDWLIGDGSVFTDAISSQDWTGEAAVDVSIVNWIKQPDPVPSQFVLDGVKVDGITASLRPTGLDVAEAEQLVPNQGFVFQGPQPVGAGFVLDPEEARAVLSENEAKYSDVVRPYLVGDDIMNQPDQGPSRYIIDFGTRSLEEAEDYPAALAIVRDRVKPFRDKNKRRARRENWWLLGELVRGMRARLEKIDRYIAGTATGKRLGLCWADTTVCPSNATNVFTFESDYAMAVLLSDIHERWARAQSSTLEDRLRYTPTSAFETFPWPTPASQPRETIGAAGVELLARRSSLCQEHSIGLTELYNRVEEGGHRDLAQLHRELDLLVADAYGWPVSAANDAQESNRRLFELSQAIAAGEAKYLGPG